MVFVNALDPIIFSVGPLAIRWYGVLYALSVLTVYFYVRHEIKRERFKVSEEAFDIGYFWFVIAMVVGARVFEILFYSPGYYLANPLRVFYIWQGGLSFHGGLVGVALAAWIWAKRKNVKFLSLADVMIVPAALVQAFVRLGNFFNSELVGKAWDGAWAVVYQSVDNIPRHPVQIYEIIYNLIVFFVLFSFRKKNWPRGSLLALFLVLYGVFRFIVEFFKVPVTSFGPLTTGQWFSIVMVGFGFWLWFWVRKKSITHTD